MMMRKSARKMKHCIIIMNNNMMIIQNNFRSFGSGVQVGGIVMNNQMSDFTTPFETTVSGLNISEANYIEVSPCVQKDFRLRLKVLL